MRRFVLVLLLCVCLLGLAACGSSGLTKAQYDAKVSHLCLIASDQVRELHMDNSVAAWRHDGASLIHIGKHFDSTLATWKAPAEVAAQAAGFLTANEKELATVKVAVAAARADYGGLLRAAIKQVNKANLATARWAKTIGATGCYIG